MFVHRTPFLMFKLVTAAASVRGVRQMYTHCSIVHIWMPNMQCTGKFYLLRENNNNEPNNEDMMKMKIIREINWHNVGMNANQITTNRPTTVLVMWFVVPLNDAIDRIYLLILRE